jgi:hypothetical protein
MSRHSRSHMRTVRLCMVRDAMEGDCCGRAILSSHGMRCMSSRRKLLALSAEPGVDSLGNTDPPGFEHHVVTHSKRSSAAVFSIPGKACAVSGNRAESAAVFSSSRRA